MTLFKITQAFAKSPEEIVGNIDVPKGVDLLNDQSGGGIGVVLFISNMIRGIIIIGGIWTILNIIFAAFTYLTSGGKADAHVKVKDRITMSVVGIILMLISYTIAALIGLIFYGDANFIITPTINQIGP